MKRIAAIAAVVVIAVVAVAAYRFARSACENEVLGRFPSSDGKLEAVAFQRSCGATTGFSTQLSVLRMGEALPNEPGNVAGSDTNGGQAPAGPGGGPELRVSWWGDQLRVWHHRQARITAAAGSPPHGVVVRHEVFD